MSVNNQVTLIGRLTKDVELRQTQGGKQIASFTLAVDDYISAENKPTYFFNIKAWEKLAEFANTYLFKGKKVALSGKLATSNWEKDGVKHYNTEIIASSIDFADDKKRDGAQPASQQPANNQQAYQPQQGYSPSPVDDNPFLQQQAPKPANQNVTGTMPPWMQGQKG